jgi:uncharacterized Zn finger protein
MGWYYSFRPYVPVAERRAAAAREVAKRTKRGQAVSPVRIDGRTIATTFWGQAWCTNLESYSDFENRLPRGRTYVRNGSVVDLKIEKGRIEALVSGSSLYTVEIDIAFLPKAQWKVLKQACAGQLGTLVELLQGKLSKAVMERVTDRAGGLFPKPKEIEMDCSCPDYAGMCKHVAAVMYGVGNRLDAAPELLFLLRGVDQRELIEQAIPAAPATGLKGVAPTLAAEDLGAIFDIEIDDAPAAPKTATVTVKPAPKRAGKKAPKAVSPTHQRGTPSPAKKAAKKSPAPKKG